ncbi:MAG TPA: hypothetical protein PK156_48235 [Polyangium sp.]|nr:hypothetical protein [Polyangium sp.]
MDTALLAFDVDGLHQGRLVRPFEAKKWMEALDDMLSRIVAKLGRPSKCFLGKTDLDQTSPPPSVLLLPIAHDARYARVDQVLVHAPGGFDEVAIAALRELRYIEIKDRAAVVTVLVHIGKKYELGQTFDHFAVSNVWQSVTPCFLFEDQKSPNLGDLEPVLCAELAEHGFPPYSQLEIAVKPGRFAPVAAIRETTNPEETLQTLSAVWDAGDPDDDGKLKWRLGFRLHFDEPVRGPMVLGFGARHGMGQFLPTNAGRPSP